MEQIKHPFEAKLFPELELVDLVTSNCEIESGCYAGCCDKDGKVDGVKYANAKSDELMAWMRPMLTKFLNSELADRYSERIIESVQKDPERWRYDYLIVRLVVKKTKSSA